MAKEQPISIFPERFRYGARRTGFPRRAAHAVGRVPMIGRLVDGFVAEPILDRDPLEKWRRKVQERNAYEGITDIDLTPENRTLFLTTALDTLLYMTDRKAWEQERKDMAEGLRTGLFDEHGDFSNQQWVIARSSLGPKVLSNVVQGVLGQDKPMLTAADVSTIFEHKGDEYQRRRQYISDLGIALTSLVGPAAAEYIILNMMPASTEVVDNPAVGTALVGGAALGIAGGIVTGAVIDALPGKDLPKPVKAAIPLVTAVLGALGGGYVVDQWVVPGMEETIQVAHVPLNEYGWTIPVVALGSFAVFGIPRMRRHRAVHDTIAAQLDDLGEWQNMLEIMANSLHYMKDVQGFMDGVHINPTTAGTVNSAIYGADHRLSSIVEMYDNREPDDVAVIKNVAGNTLKDLARQVVLAEMISFDQGYAAVTAKGDPNPTIKGFIPKASEYFATLTTDGLKAASDTCALVKRLADRDDHVAALSLVSPSLPQIMITQAQRGKLGPRDDTQHFGRAGMNTGTRGVFVHLVEGTMENLLTIPDSKRAVLLDQLHALGEAYTHSIPIGGLDRIYQPPSHLQLGTLYGYSYLRARGHVLGDLSGPGEMGEYGSKGLLSDVGKAALGAYEQNPLITYMFLADLGVAVDMADTLLIGMSPRSRKTIKDGLVSLQREISSELLRRVLPKDKKSAVEFFIDGDKAFKVYTAITMLTEVCGDSVVLPLLKKQAVGFSPLFGLNDAELSDPANPTVLGERKYPGLAKLSGIVGDTPNLYTTQLIDFIHNSKRHTTQTHRRMTEFLERGILPLLAREYLDRLIPGGRGEAFTEAQLENTLAFAGYAIESLHRDDFIPVIAKLVEVMESTQRIIIGTVAPMGTVSPVPKDIQSQAAASYRRATALLQIAQRVVAGRKDELNAVVIGRGKHTYATQINTLTEQITRAMGENVRVKIAVK